MSLTFILTLSSLSGYGAKAVRDTISLNLQEVKLESFVEVMKQKTGLNFLYCETDFRDCKRGELGIRVEESAREGRFHV